MSFRQHWRWSILAGFLVALGIAGATWGVMRHRAVTPKPVSTPSAPATKKATTTPKASQPSTAQPTQPQAELITPVADFRGRITKKLFGTYVTPAHSPVQPERFTGYHAGVDVEYGDVTADVPVRAIADGTVRYAGWVSGYGGVAIFLHHFAGADHTVLYGHLDPSRLPRVGSALKRGEWFAYLGRAYSSQTDGERRHLHFSILQGSGIVFLGYAQSLSQLRATWLDPLSFAYQG